MGGGGAEPADASGGRSAGSGGRSAGSGGSSHIPDECFRPYICVDRCGEQGENYGCEPCPEDKIDSILCSEDDAATGLYGTVHFLEGNHQPTTSGPTSGTTTPVAREIRIYLPVTESQLTESTDRADEAYAVYSKIQGTVVAEAHSAQDGKYSAELEPGTYSVFVEDEGDWYCNHHNSEGFCLVEVTDSGAPVEYNIEITYAASF